MATNPPPESWELATPVFGIRYPRPTAPAQKLPDAFTHIGGDLENALLANAFPPGSQYKTGTHAERLAATPTRDLIWVETDTGAMFIGTGTAWLPLTGTALPDPVNSFFDGQNAISSTGWANLPNRLYTAFTASAALWVYVEASAWHVATSGDVRMGINLTGATTMGPAAGGIGSASIGSAPNNGTRLTTSRVALLNPGVTNIEVQGMIPAGSAAALNYPTLKVIPQYWD